MFDGCWITAEAAVAMATVQIRENFIFDYWKEKETLDEKRRIDAVKALNKRSKKQ